MLTSYETIAWAAMIIVFTMLEAATLGLTSIWFAVGALASLVAAVMGFNLFVQVVVFIIVALILLIYTRPIAKRVLKIGKNKTNTDALIGQRAYVTKAIGPHETGLVKVNGQIWTAKSVDGELIDVEANVEILAIEGVKLIVKGL
jgi:membrane protein implicated in regulation of membrane protease activity